MTRLGIAALFLLVCANAHTAWAQEFAPLFDGTSLKGWKVEHTKAEVRSGVLQIGKGSGWVRTDRPFANFVLKLDMRVKGADAKGGVFVRAWPTFDQDRNPSNGYRCRSWPTAAP